MELLLPQKRNDQVELHFQYLAGSEELRKGKAMPFEPEFKKHLHSLMVGVAEKTSDECVRHKNELVGKAIATQNSAATPIAYKDAALYAMEFRLSKTIEKYIEAVAIWGYTIDSAFEQEMIKEFWSLTAGPKQLQFPPAIRGQHVQAVQGAYIRERSRLAAQLVREGTNRLRELKMRTKNTSRAVANSTTNVFNAPVGNAYINSPVHTTNHIVITAPILQDIDHISEGNVELQAAAIELRNAQSQGSNAVDRLQKWATLANSVGGLAEKIHQYYPHLAALVSHWIK